MTNPPTNQPTNPTPDRGRELADQLAKESRAQEARMLPAKGDLTQAQIEYVQDRVKQYCDDNGLTIEQMDSKMASTRGALIRFVNSIATNSDTFVRKVDRWITQQRDGRASSLPTQMVSTGVTDRMIGVLKMTNQRNSMSAIVGPSGVGKSLVLKAAARNLIPNSIHVELASTDKTLVAFLRTLCASVCSRRNGSGQVLMRGIIDELKGSDRMVMVDEVHYLNADSLNALRDIHKQTGCPIVMIGTADVLDSINDFNQFHGQFKSLVAMVYNITDEVVATGGDLYTIDEVVEYAKAMNLRLSIDGSAFLVNLCNTLGWGGLRSAGHLLLNADMMRVSQNKRSGTNKTHITELHLRIALRDMEGASGFQRTITRMETTRRSAVA